MAFINTRLLDRVEYGFQGRLTYATNTHTLRSGNESRNATRTVGRWTLTAMPTDFQPEDYALILAAFNTLRGSNDSCRMKNWLDYIVVGQSLGITPAGSTPVQLIKSSTFGGVIRNKNITKPVSGTVTVYQAGVAKVGTVNLLTGLFTPTTAWTAAQALTANFEWDVPARFTADELPATYEDWRRIRSPIDMIEVFGE